MGALRLPLLALLPLPLATRAAAATAAGGVEALPFATVVESLAPPAASSAHRLGFESSPPPVASSGCPKRARYRARAVASQRAEGGASLDKSLLGAALLRAASASACAACAPTPSTCGRRTA